MMHCIHGDDVYELFELPADEERRAKFCAAPLIEWFGVSVWHVIKFNYTDLKIRLFKMMYLHA